MIVGRKEHTGRETVYAYRLLDSLSYWRPECLNKIRANFNPTPWRDCIGYSKRISQMRAPLAARRELAGVQNRPPKGF